MNCEQPVSAALVEAAINGGTPEADELIRVVWPRAYRLAFSVVRDRTLAEDAAQEACAVLFRSIRGLRCVDAFAVWFYRIAVRQALAVERRNASAAVEPDGTSDSALEESLLRLDVCNALAVLTPQQRIAIALYYYAEMNSREIAQVLGIQDSSVRFHLMRAKRSLEKSLRDQNRDDVRAEEPYGAA